jgi:2,5-dioxopentanoate dehydrogenase
MSKVLAVLSLVLAVSAAAVAISAVQGNLPLATVTYTVKGNQSGSQNSAISTNGSVYVLTPAQLNLGNLTAGGKGNASATAKILVNSSGYFEIELNDNAIKHVFSHFVVQMQIGNQTVTLTMNDNGKGQHHASGHNEAVIYLAKGTYNVTITVYYHVKNHVSNVTVTNAPLLKIMPYHGHDHHEDHDNKNE